MVKKGRQAPSLRDTRCGRPCCVDCDYSSSGTSSSSCSGSVGGSYIGSSLHPNFQMLGILGAFMWCPWRRSSSCVCVPVVSCTVVWRRREAMAATRPSRSQQHSSTSAVTTSTQQQHKCGAIISKCGAIICVRSVETVIYSLVIGLVSRVVARSRVVAWSQAAHRAILGDVRARHGGGHGRPLTRERGPSVACTGRE